ncbi:uncharacterized protein LOC135340249 isoform X4 [Halichondria panicea]|uniref:uncharacterized protein LOC135340249 isoform X4 n=1 Tax=Halichondria panicea TaxID=6063 RepID=UPI00312B9158
MRIQLCVQIILKRLRLNSKVMTKISSKLPTLNAESELMVETDEARDKAPSPNCPLLMRVSLWWMNEARDKAPLLILMVVSLLCRMDKARDKALPNQMTVHCLQLHIVPALHMD